MSLGLVRLLIGEEKFKLGKLNAALLPLKLSLYQILTEGLGRYIEGVL